MSYFVNGLSMGQIILVNEMRKKSHRENMTTISPDTIPLAQVAESPLDGRNDQNDSTHASQNIAFDRQSHDVN